MYKHKLLIAVSSLFALLLVSTGVQAQYDDMYYDPDNFRSTEVARDFSDDSYDRAERDDDRRYGNFDDDYYDYYYTSRIRRFNRPYTGFGYYDPVYVDVAYYDPFFRPAGTTVLIYNSFGNAYNPRFSRWGGAYGGWNRGYAGAFGWDDPFFYGRAYNPRFGRGAFGSPFGYGNPYAYGGYGNFGGVYGAGAGYYCPPAWGGGNTYTVPNSINDRPVSTAPRAATTSIADRVERARRNAAVTPRSADGRSIQSGAIRGGENTRAVGRTRTSDDTRIDRSRTTVRPRSTESQRAIPQRATRPDNRTYTPSRSTTPTRSATPSRSGNSRNYTPSRSATPSRNYTPSRSAAPTRSAAPARSVSPSRGSSSGAGRSAAPSRRGGGGEDEA